LGLKKNNVNIFLSENIKIKFVILCGDSAAPNEPSLERSHLKVAACILSLALMRIPPPGVFEVPKKYPIKPARPNGVLILERSHSGQKIQRSDGMKSRDLMFLI
jgi:hypothetical protein